MTTLFEFAQALAARTKISPPAADTPTFALFEQLQHQGTPKALAYRCMAELVEVDSCRDLWERIGIIAAHANGDGGLDRQGPEIAEAFRKALERAALRLEKEPSSGLSAHDQQAMLGAYAAVRGQAHLQAPLESLEYELNCPRCGTYLSFSTSSGTPVLRSSRAEAALKPWTLSAETSNAVKAKNAILKLAQQGRRQSLVDAAANLMGKFTCPRCKRESDLAQQQWSKASEEGLRREDPISPEPLVLNGHDTAVEEVSLRLCSIAAESSNDVVRLAGVGSFAVKRYSGYSGRDSKTGKVIPVAEKLSPLWMPDDYLRRMVSGRAAGRPPLASDAASVDSLAAAILAGFEHHDEVVVPRIGVFTRKESAARPGATVDGEPIIVSPGATVAFRTDGELKARVNSVLEKEAALPDEPS